MWSRTATILRGAWRYRRGASSSCPNKGSRDGRFFGVADQPPGITQHVLVLRWCTAATCIWYTFTIFVNMFFSTRGASAEDLAGVRRRHHRQRAGESERCPTMPQTLLGQTDVRWSRRECGGVSGGNFGVCAANYPSVVTHLLDTFRPASRRASLDPDLLCFRVVMCSIDRSALQRFRPES